MLQVQAVSWSRFVLCLYIDEVRINELNIKSIWNIGEEGRGYNPNRITYQHLADLSCLRLKSLCVSVSVSVCAAADEQPKTNTIYRT